ncbi:MAG: DUF1570 domain-containing protein [Planctomycetota bacterium]|nr:MAG: DUF1570 domain-containing protein [Planctomycetota bacterium]
MLRHLVRRPLIQVLPILLIGCATRPRARVADLTPTAPTAELWTGEGLAGKRILTEHFELIATLGDEALMEALPDFLEQAYTCYVETLPPPDSAGRTGSKRRLTTYVFGHRSQWEHYLRRRHPAWLDVHGWIRHGGFTDGTTSYSFFTNRPATLATVAHEGWHQYVARFYPDTLPAWLNEGLACGFESVAYESKGPRFRPRRNPWRLNTLRKALQQDRLIPLEELLAMETSELADRREAGIAERYYAQSWALVTWLRFEGEPKRKRAFDRMLQDVRAGTFRAKVTGAVLTESRLHDAPFPRAAYVFYFDETPADAWDAYYEYLVRLVGFAR